jgi:Ca-activated chloride channel family protein
MLGVLVASAPAAPAAVHMQPIYEQSVIAPGTAAIHVLIKFNALSSLPQTQGPRPPVNLALVIDRSGSMSERGKLEYAKMAARDLIGRLSDKDYAALVVYDSAVSVQMKASAMTAANKNRMLNAIDNLRPAGATNLSGGMTTGIRQIDKLDSAGLRRVILLSDGLANEGETSHYRLGEMAAQARQGGVSLSAMGLGESYDEDRMQLLAQRGGGNYYYIRDPEDSSRFFASELKGIMAGVTKGVTLTLRPGGNVADVKIHGYTSSRDNGAIKIDLSDFYAEEERSMMLELSLKELASGQLDLGELDLQYEALPAAEPGAASVKLQAAVDSDAGKQAASVNREVQALALAAQIDRQYAQALAAAKGGDFAQAEKLIDDARSQLRNSPLTRESEILELKERSMALESSRIQAVAAAPAPAQQDYIKSSAAKVYSSGMGKPNALQMKMNSRGLEVELLQKSLTRLNYYHGPIDGVYSAAVQEAVTKYQQDNGLTPDGIAGPETQAALGL